MKEEFENYLDALAMPEPIRDRVRLANRFYEDHMGAIIEFLHVTDRVDSQGTRVFGSAWFFTQTNAMEAHDFVSKEDFDAAVNDEILFWRVTTEHYEFGNATDQSRMQVTYATDGSSGDLTATGTNCDSLWDIHLGFFVPNGPKLAASPVQKEGA